MRRCAKCREPIDAHTRQVVPIVLLAMIQKSARDVHDANRRRRELGRRCPIEIVRTDGAIPVYRAVRPKAAS